MVTVVKQGIVCDKHIVWNHLLDHWVTAVLDINLSATVQLRTHIVVVLGNVGKRCIHIEPCQSLRRALNPLRLTGNRIAHRTEKIVFQRIQFILRTENRILEFLQTRGNVALRIRQRLFSRIVIRDKIFKRVRDLQIIAEYLVVFDLHIFDAGFLALTCLKLTQPLFALGLGVTVIIDHLVVAVLDHTAVAHQIRWIIHDCRIDKLIEVFQRVEILLNLRQSAAVKRV